jgi:hypothetical protein
MPRNERERDVSYHAECDWCGAWLSYDADQAQMSVVICHRKGSRLDAQWSEEAKQTRHFCAAPKEDTDRGGRNRAGLVPEPEFESCYDRAIAAMTRTELGDPGMGMEWRLMPVDAPKPTNDVRSAPKAPAPSPELQASAASSAPPSNPQLSQCEQEHDQWQELERRRGTWRHMPWEGRESYVLDALGEGQLTAGELAAKLNARFGWPTDWRATARRWVELGPLGRPPIESEAVRPAVMRLLARGEVDRVNAPHGNRPAVWHFFRTASAEPANDGVTDEGRA